MTTRLQNTLFATFLHDALATRGITIEHLADLLSPVPENDIRGWFDGHSIPARTDLETLGEALRIDTVELIAGWMIAQRPAIEGDIRSLVLDPLGSGYPRTTDLHLRASRPRTNMNVGDPHDMERTSSEPLHRTDKPIRKRASGAR